MKDVLKSIWKKRLFSLLIFLQMMFSILYFFVTAISIQATVNSQITVKKEIDSPQDRTIHMEVQNEESENFNKFKTDLLKSNMVENFSGWQNNLLTLEDYIPGEVNSNSEIDCVTVAKNSEMLKEISVESGRNFSDDDYNNQKADGTEEKPFSMILGSDFAVKNNLKTGDRFSDYNENNYIIVGILKPNSKWFYQTISEGMIMIMDNAVMVAYTGDIENPLMHYYSVVEENSDPRVAIETINHIAQKNDITLSAELISTELSRAYDESIKENSSWMIFSLVILIFVAIGTSILIVSHMYMRRTEIGIRMAYGYSFNKILFLLWGEFLTVAVVAFLSALTLSNLFFSNGKQQLFSAYYISQYHLSADLVVIGVAMFVLMCLPSIFALVFKLKKVQPKDLIGEK